MRLLALVLALGFTASAVLELRSRRLEMLHAMAVLHLDMDRHRRAAWDLQHRVSRATSPSALSDAVAAADGRQRPDHAEPDRPSGPHAPSRESADRGVSGDESASVRGFEAIPHRTGRPRP